MVEPKTLSFLGIAEKAGAVISGSETAEKAIRSGKAHVAIVAGDASEPTKKKFKNLCSHFGVPLFIFADRETLGHIIGKEFRAAMVLTDKGIARTLIGKLKQEGLETAAEEQS